MTQIAVNSTPRRTAPTGTIMRMAVMNSQGEVIDRQRRPLATREELAAFATHAELYAAVVELRDRITEYHPEELAEVWTSIGALEARLRDMNDALVGEIDLVSTFDQSLTP